MRCQSWDISLVALGILEPLIFALVTAVLASHRPAPTFLIEETVLALCKVEVLVATFAKEGVDHSMVKCLQSGKRRFAGIISLDVSSGSLVWRFSRPIFESTFWICKRCHHTFSLFSLKWHIQHDGRKLSTKCPQSCRLSAREGS